MRLNAATVRALSLPPGKDDKIFFDDSLPGFGLRLRSSGAKTWMIQYAIAGRTRRMVLGTAAVVDPAKAREAAKNILAEVQLGGDPAGEKSAARSRAGETFKACLDLYLKRRRNEQVEGKLRATTIATIERHLCLNLKGLHATQIDKVDRRAIALELGRLTAANKLVQANRTRTSLVKFLNWCAGEGFIDSNPAIFTNKNPEQSRDRVLTDTELQKIWLALGEGDYADIIRLLTLTGQRASEIGNLRFDEIDFDRGIITLSPARTKNRRWHIVPLAPVAINILKRRRPFNNRPLVFGTGRGGFNGWGKAKIRLDERSQVTGWRTHDLRRTAATRMAEIGIQPHIVEAVLNHVSGAKGGVAGIYNKAGYENEKAAALARWAEYLMAVVEGRQSIVTPFKRA